MQKTIQIAAKLYELRDAAHLILGDKFAGKMADIGAIVRQTAETHKISILQAAKNIASDEAFDGYEKILVLAAAVELIEPLKQTNPSATGVYRLRLND